MSFARRFETSLRQLAHHEAFLFPRAEIPPEFQRAAVLIPFWPQDGGLRTVLTRRSTRIRAHKGQVSFAGGRLDPGESWEQAALREAHEEIGIEPHRVEVIGRLDDAWSGAGHHVVPIVGWLAAPPVLVANEREVAEILVADVEELLRPKIRSEEAFWHEGHRYVNPVLDWEGGDAFGLSADLLLEALSWGEGAPRPGGPARLDDLVHYRRRSRDPVFPDGAAPKSLQPEDEEPEACDPRDA